MLVSPLGTVGFLYALISGISALLFLYVSISNGKKGVNFFIISLISLLVHFSGIEWFLWIGGYNLFDLLLEPIVPLTSYFIGWFIIIIYLSEKYFKKRWIWIAFTIFCAIIFIIARFCMNCL
ncbi:MAG: hypothetical protein OH319_00775 [Candidatus Parvarchaeota archaeon]|nr:hypothetical protein [Candidatus Jingweiarchaeum tengchongense]MCW1297888.1 hypothetical protein [Candidatus Jingweiarchaeum tengchongense]MCW1299899.1 hypothetical protein [Candidatus Jingweiarchaeum tengchongense]MCW1305097.1 hypothetical protein [Candidatus Jingweiarchaeum tengchongense]MCW1305159.1 hypothetical protein [Candidatus Jingweiarchaeum tengchongense]